MLLLGTTARPVCRQCHIAQQIRHATLLRRPKRPYTFTQLITLSDGSTFTHRTTSPQPVYRTTKDTKNSPRWNPSSRNALDVEQDEAGRLKRFRKKFGRGYDAETMGEGRDDTGAQQQTGLEWLLDATSTSAQKPPRTRAPNAKQEEAKKSGKGKEKEKAKDGPK